MTDLINRAVVRAGDIICRRSDGLISDMICLTTRQWSWNHDAIVVRAANGTLWIGDALMGPGCQLTPIAEWEWNCRSRGHRMIILRPAGASAIEGEDAGRWWRDHVLGHAYDHVAIWQLARKFIFGTWWKAAVGNPARYYCSEGVRDSWHNGTALQPWGNAVNVDPGTTVESYKLGRLVEVEGALTDAGLGYRCAV